MILFVTTPGPHDTSNNCITRVFLFAKMDTTSSASRTHPGYPKRRNNCRYPESYTIAPSFVWNGLKEEETKVRILLVLFLALWWRKNPTDARGAMDEDIFIVRSCRFRFISFSPKVVSHKRTSHDEHCYCSRGSPTVAVVETKRETKTTRNRPV